MTANQHSTNKATRSQVQLGSFEIEGYLLPEAVWTDSNKFGVSKTQAVLLAYPEHERNRAADKFTEVIRAKKAKSIVPQGFQLHGKIKTNSGKADAPIVDLLPVDQLPLFLKVCSKLGSEDATDLLIDLAGLSLQQLFSDAFSIKFEQEERQDWLKLRDKTKEDFWFLTDSIQDYYDNHPRIEQYREENYSRVFDDLNVGLFGK